MLNSKLALLLLKLLRNNFVSSELESRAKRRDFFLFMEKFQTYDYSTKQRLYRYLQDFMTAERVQRFEEVIAQRTRHLCVVTENLFQSHNASAIMRSCDCTGVQDIHAIENDFNPSVNVEIAMGSEKWLDLHHYSEQENNTTKTLQSLKNKGYKIVCTSLREPYCDLEELPVDQKIALVFGTELSGLTEEALAQADICMKIPMVGFTESYNVSVSAAISLYTLTQKIRQSTVAWQLSDEEKIDILLNWCHRSIRAADEVIEHWTQREL